MKDVRIGLLGFGTVGAGVVEALRQNADVIARRLGARLVLRRIADVDLKRDRGVAVDRSMLTIDAGSVIRDPTIDVVVELIGGTGVARELVKEALKLGKPVVTANKALLAGHGAELFALSAQHKVPLYFEASVGGGIPIIRALRQGLIANRIDSIYGILNGTCNYILTRMERDRLGLDESLRQAQEEGYAEADPSLDIDGPDTAHKAVILASLAWGSVVPMSAVHVEGIRGLAETDIHYALDMGYRIKMLAVLKRTEEQVDVRVHPTLVPIKHLLASVHGVYNAILVRGDLTGNTIYYGRGAGRNPTASAVISDMADAARWLAGETHVPPADLPHAEAELKPKAMGRVRSRDYLRILMADSPGVLAEIASILGRNDISIASVMQKEAGSGGHVPVVMVTHGATEGRMKAALKEIDATKVVGARTVRLRIEDCE